MKFRWIGLFLALLAPLAQPAAAHDQLVDSSPGQGQTVDAGVLEISLTFAEDLLNLGSGAQIIVTGPDSEQLINNGCALIKGNIANSPIQLSEPGEYLVGWRVVSVDGHPISGSFSFDLVNETGFVSDPNFQGLDCADAITQADYEPTSEPSTLNYWLLFGSVGAVAAGLFFWLRPRNPTRGAGPKGQD